jgi:geranylgeranyl diphosphate synthase type 3
MMACCTTNVDVCVRLSSIFQQHLWLIKHTTRDYVPLVNLIGVYFQIRDDLMNLQSTEVVRLP